MRGTMRGKHLPSHFLPFHFHASTQDAFQLLNACKFLEFLSDTVGCVDVGTQ
jgi:hypothetical protein